MNQSIRTRTFAWSDPRSPFDAYRDASGLDTVRAILRGDLPFPPVASVLSFEPGDAEPGRVGFAMRVEEHQYNLIGSVHGGVIATLLDTAMGHAVLTLLEAGERYTTLDLHTYFVRPVTLATGRVFCEGRVLHRGRRYATAEGRVTDAAGRLHAHGTCSCMVMAARS